MRFPSAYQRKPIQLEIEMSSLIRLSESMTVRYTYIHEHVYYINR